MAEALALVRTDLVDSTAINARLGDTAMAQLWVRHDAMARDLMRVCDGREISREDGFLVVFPDADKAVRFVSAYHQTLGVLDPDLKARAGVHVGPVQLRENSPADTARGSPRYEIDGISVPIVSRLMSVALGGQTLATPDAVAALSSAGMLLRSHGFWRLKGLPEPIELIEAGDSNSSFQPPADTARAYRVVRRDGAWLPVADLAGTVPAERDAFVGRHQSLRSVAELLESTARLVTVLGIGGIGKTRLAIRYARSWLGDYPGGAWFCDLSAARSLEGIVQAVASGMSVPLGRTDPVEQLGSAIAGRDQCLIVLDNFEQVASFAEETLGRWLDQAPKAKFLVTSREVLGVPGEFTCALGPMDSSEAHAMFLERVRAVGVAGFSKPDQEAIGELLDLLDRLPLAIELAAARTRLIPPSQLCKRMGERLNLLRARGGRRDRQATLRATLDWSWDLLSRAEQQALAQLSVFEGGFDLPAAEAVIETSDSDSARDNAALVQGLFEKSLAMRRGKDRFDLLSVVQEYAAERLAAVSADAVTTAQVRHGAHFVQLDPSNATRVCAEQANLVVATRRAALGGRAVMAANLLEVVWTAFKLRGPFQAALDLAENVRQTAGLSPRDIARVDRIAGWALKMCGQNSLAEVRLTEALAAAEGASDAECAADVRSLLGDALLNVGRTTEAREQYERVLSAAASLKSATLATEAHTGLGNLSRSIGMPREARHHYEGALAAARSAGNRRWEGGSLGNLGTICIDQGDRAAAERYFTEALAVARELGDRQWEGNTLCNLGLMHLESGLLEPALAELGDALHASRELGHRRLECIVLCNLGLALEGSNKPDEAASNFDAALRLAHLLGDRRAAGQVLTYLGLLHCRQGRFDAGDACFDEAETFLAEVEDQGSLGVLFCARAERAALAGATAQAAQFATRARQLANAVDVQAGTELALALQRAESMLGSAPVPPSTAAQAA